MRLIWLVFGFSVALQAQTADEIADKVIAATGGTAKFAQIQSLLIKGRMKFGPGEFGPITVTAKRPDKFRMELQVGPDHVTQAYDGKVGWQSVSGQHQQAPAALQGVSLAHLIDQAVNAIGGPLLDREPRHNKVALGGRGIVDGVDCFQLLVTLGTGDTMTLFVNAKTFLVTREELPVEMEGKPGIVEETVGNYRRFGPVLMACLFVTRPLGGEEKDNQRMEFDSAEINPVVEDRFFQLPAH